MNKKLDEIKTRHAQRTPGPYMWDVNTKHQTAELKSIISPRYLIMDFYRWGFQNAGPVFRDFKRNIMFRVEQFAKPRAAHHPNFDMYIDHPDAIGLEKSWEDVEELLKLVDRLKIAMEAVERQVKDPHNRGAKTEGQQRGLMDYIWWEIVRPAVEEVRGNKESERRPGK